MLESMTVKQYQEWLAFFNIRNSKTEQSSKKKTYGTSKEGQKQLSGDLLRAMSGYQKRRENKKPR